MDGPYALDYGPILSTADKMGIVDIEDFLIDINTIEDAILDELSKKKPKAKNGAKQWR
jgi:hypothetical protein